MNIIGTNKYLCNFKPHISSNLIGQRESVEWLAKYHGSEYLEMLDKYAVKPEHIESRMIYAPGVAGVPADPRALYGLNDDGNPDMTSRSEIAQRVAENIFQDLYHDETSAPVHINHVSCTQYQSPSAAQRLVVNKAWHEATEVTHLYHMGCYAAFPALRVSGAYVEGGAERVDVVHTELCSFHLNKEKVSADQIIMKTLFADGAIRYSLTDESWFRQNAEQGYEILTRHEILVPGTENEMSWKIGPQGFVMTLTKLVPVILARTIEEFMGAMFAQAGLDFVRDKERTLFAVHPGGPKIVESIQRVLELAPHQVSHSLDILKKRGNMSSATVPYIWDHILNDDQTHDQQIVASVAFGPGLTVTGALLKICKR